MKEALNERMPCELKTDFVVFVFQPMPSIFDRLKSAIGLANSANAQENAVEFGKLLTVLQTTKPADSATYGGMTNPDGEDNTPEGDGDDELPQLMASLPATEGAMVSSRSLDQFGLYRNTT